jgi:hypothetical protein
MDKNTLLKVQEAFDANPDAKVLFATSDGQCFATLNEARFHAKSLQDQKTLPLTKDLVEKFLNPVTQEPSAEDKIKAEVAPLKVDDLKARLTAEFSKTEEDLKGLKKEALGELLLSLLLAAHAEKINSEQ